MLSKLGVNVVLANDGRQGVDSIVHGESVDLILMDLQMPVLDGYGATQEIRKWETSHGRPKLPIIALTASAFLEDRMRCKDVGMDDFIFKPIQFETLVSVLTRWLPSTLIQHDPADLISSPTRVLDRAKVMKLMTEIRPLLERNKFDAIGLFRELRECVSGTDLEDEIAEVGQLLERFHFDQVLNRLQQMIKARKWSENSNE
jgi:CheY-like chemotaxis protein